jgi:hypothetical protein
MINRIIAGESEKAITKEEEAILWRSIERVPEIYREPLILFCATGTEGNDFPYRAFSS